ncbi:MAG: radical SAM protein [Spirochaetes bacterium]|nr:radical SAM protein [Spirochaetota bacterium]
MNWDQYLEKKRKFKSSIDSSGNLVIPAELVSAYGLNPGSEVYLTEHEDFLKLHMPVSHLTRVYIEPTTRCNLDCKTCIRNVWDEPQGSMSEEVFTKIMKGLDDFSPVPDVFFGGFGEPLVHPRILQMISEAKSRGSFVELITNGTLLTKEMSKNLIDAGLDMIWVSLDGATPESYADVRMGAELPNVLENMKEFHVLRLRKNVRKYDSCAEPDSYRFFDKPYMGIAFVAMKRNIHDLPAILSIANRFSVSRVHVSNLLPYTEEMAEEILFPDTIAELFQPMLLDLPLIRKDSSTKEALYEAARTLYSQRINGATPSELSDRCPFIEKGSTAVSWAGDISPCLPLLHSYNGIVNGREHFRRRHQVANITENTLKEIWEMPDYVSFRDRVKMFDFSPCSTCGGCDLSEDNETDCMGSEFPTCGNCLWAQGLIRCP